ncbi:TerB family tellurite resistance protein [Roseateles asaccharophilus]|uniref:Tellurite resistance protein B-like protein n=1 Tax=Roseateles asaccharophilus TaxID=582607 RepID=A0ABU2ABJ1_9BURK|nr:TerB family tellurite resistance protein [Roseateles asaccharophilus]MDR7334559.1 putative tellurite resistance protein B-like protein [Roseateles asaccharophilus]
MRSYPTDSPQAVARIVALALLADGNVHPRELEALRRLRQCPPHDLPDATLHGVMREFCEDLLATHAAAPSSTLTLDDTTISALLDEVQDESLRIRVLQLCAAVIEADEHLARGEFQVLQAAARRWRVSVDRLDLLRALDAAHA